MIFQLLPEKFASIGAFVGILFAFLTTIIATDKLCAFLPKDAGREFAHDGKKSAGKPRGAGIIFVLAFVLASLLFVPIQAENIIYLVLIIICMMTGFWMMHPRILGASIKKGSWICVWLHWLQ